MRVQTYFIKYINTVLQLGKKTSGGRNFQGRICIFHRGNINRRMYKFIDFFRRLDMWGYVFTMHYDPNRTAYISPILYLNGLASYIISAEEMKKKSLIFSGSKSHSIVSGSTNILKNIPLFSLVSMVELKPFLGAKLCRAAGAKCLLIGKKKTKAILKLPSTWQVHVSWNAMAMYGQISNAFHRFDILNKAGKHRALGFRPKVRGVAKNPCDHPHGGGNGKKSHPPVPVTAWGKWTTGTPTTKTQVAIIRRRLFKNCK
jgi:large subunit ribosomal protein L2